MKRILSVVALSSLLLASPLHANEDNPPPGITVEGEAAVKVMPDEVLITLGIESSDRDLQKVRSLNDARMQQVRGAALASGVAERDIRTDFIHLAPNYENRGRDARRVLIDYTQQTTVLITLRDVSKFEGLMTGLLRSGVEYIHGVDFQTSELRKYRDQARLLAMKAAREKAVALAGAFEQKVGKAKLIQEGRGGWWSSYGRWWGGSGSGQMSQNVAVQAPGEASADGALAPGMLSVTASVRVTFELE